MNRIKSSVLGLLFICIMMSTVQAAPPIVTDVKPSGGSFSGSISINASATDSDGYIVNVTFYYSNGTEWELIGQNTSVSGNIHSRNWDTTRVTNGNYQIKAIAFDNNTDSNESISSATFTIDNNQKPLVWFNSPNNGETVNKLVILNTTATDSDGSISEVTFEYKLSSSSSWTDLGPYGVKNGNFYLKNWDTETIENGSYDIRVTAKDDDSETNSSITKNVIVNNQPNILPSIIINFPTDGQTYTGKVQLNATATDSDGIITNVTFEFYDGSKWTPLGSYTSKSGNYYFLDWNTSSAENGPNYKVKAIATDNRTGTMTNTTGTFSIYNQRKPILSKYGATPESGITPQEFEFKVTYTDEDNESANYVRLVLEGIGTFDMSAIDNNDSKDGIVYNYSKILTTTTTSTKYKYNFIARDKNNSDATPTDKKTIEVHPATYKSGNRIWDENANLSKTYEWNPQSFSGFYYDLDTDEGSETLTIEDIDRSLGRGDIKYETSPIPVKFEQDRWKTYEVIGFMADRYFAGYTDNTTFASSDENLLDERQLSRVLMDTDKKYNLRSGNSLELEEGYEIRISEFASGGDAVMVALFKNGEKVSEDIVEEDDTLVFEKDLGGAEDIPIIAVYFDSVFVGTETSTVVIEGIFQISDDYIDVSRGDTFGLMEIDSVTSSGIKMENDDSVSLGRGDDFNLMGKINIIVADHDTLRFAPYVDMSEPGTYELRGTVTEEAEFDWTPFNFEGLLYDIDTGEGNETLHIKRSGTKVNENDLVYTTNPISKNFEHNADGWKTFQSIGFMGDTYFAGYLKDSSFISSDRSLIKEGKLSEILIDEDKKHTMHIGNQLTLEEGYSLRIDEISREGGSVMLTLLKDGKEISTDIAREGDTYIYEIEVDNTDIPVIVAHIDSVFRGMETNSIFIDGLFQISDSFTTIERGDTYGVMKVTSFSSESIVMKNDDDFSLSKGDSVNIMGDIKFKVADSSVVRFYPYQEIIVKEPLYLDLDIPDSVYENEEFIISVTSDGDEVEGVSIIFDDSEIGTTDSNGQLIYTPVETGEFRVTASKSGYESDSKDIEVLYQPKLLEISAPLLVDRDVSIVISVTSEGQSVSGASVMFGSTDLGTTPSSGNITYTPDQVGTHTITASKSGYQDAVKDIDVTDPSARLVYSNLTVEPKSVQPGQTVNITVVASNFGTLREADTMTLKVNGKAVVERELVLGPGEITKIDFTINRSKPGTYRVEVDGRSDTFRVIGSQISSIVIIILAIMAILIITAVIYSFSQGTISSAIIMAKFQAFKEALRRLIER